MLLVSAPRPVVPRDLPRLLTLNNAAVPNVNALTLAQLTELVRISTVALTAQALTAQHDHEPACLLLALSPGEPYDSANYRWFSEHSPDFLYLDRIVVAQRARSAGLGARLHAELCAHARALGLGRITCEVNVVPPNPGSYRFHTRLGFSTVGRLSSADGKEVVLMERPVQH